MKKHFLLKIISLSICAIMLIGAFAACNETKIEETKAETSATTEEIITDAPTDEEESTENTTTEQKTDESITTLEETTEEISTAEETTAAETTDEETTAEVTTAEETTEEETTKEETTEEQTTEEETTEEVTTEEETTEAETQPNEEPVDPTMPKKEYALTEISDDVKHLGRTQLLSTGVACDNTASGIAFKAYIENQIAITISNSSGDDAYFTVYVDGVRLDTRFKISKQSTENIVIDKLGAKTLRKIEIVKQTEPQKSLTVIEKLTFNGELVGPDENRELYIEFIGDSITSGFGNLCPSGTESANQALYHDGTRTYAALTAQSLGADYSVISCSGIGVEFNAWFAACNAQTYFSRASYYRSSAEKFDFSSARVPDIVVINLGTNDQNHAVDTTSFKEKVKSLITFVRESYGKDITIVWVYNMMSDGYFTHTQTVLDEMGGESAGLYYIKMEKNNGGGSGHPSGKAQVAAGEKLTEFLAELAVQPNEAPVEPTMPKQEYKLSDISSQIKHLGRTQILSSGLACDNTASGIAFKAYIENEITVSLTVTADTYFTVYVDGIRLYNRYKVTPNDGDIVINKLGGKKLRTIEILKQTEPKLSLCVINRLTFNGELVGADDNRDLYIEFIGDDITSGYGNLGSSETQNAGDALYMDGTKTYASVASELIGADYSVISCNGIGIYYGEMNKPGAQTENSFSIGDYYPSASYYRSNTEKYDFSSARVPDIVVINLGTNDKAYSSTVNTFKENVKALIEYIREVYGKNVPIVWVFNMMNDGYSTNTRAVINEMGGESAGLYAVGMYQNNTGGGERPSLEAQISSGERLVAFMKAKGLIK